ncbi:formate dehydrogenase subunit alpha [Yersinia pestis]|uniref:Formate dehydrogenase H n=23 Tax=Yersinia pestis TaxID=632 RepID=A0AAX2I4A1_YERPE|nr:formate dehydrogenase subunit alpha [Yersinia pestis]EDR34134.1 anaerobic formate dehydrogenase, alpha subunit, archaeal-type [Yersinia pestis biovar Orientalis str. IP275]EFA48325.1 formate dehydrogenase, alpha subunit [Yersinia pestis KIM D27]ERP80582.1 formate dehydrogenase [Yersinia pestis S3]ERP80630.1 formate dehydrogenase [Yersinia pestis 24H]AAM84189.1 selenopolypeptide subunit of formate dehydrogenase H [Yersinia pestis KIM10+]
MKKILTVCPYCGSGCKLNLLVEDGEIVGAEPADGVTNQGALCLKGYYGWDFLNDTRLLTPRLTTPLLRRQRGEAFQPVSWEAAIAFITAKLSAIKERHGPDAIMMTGSSRGPGNEANYVMQKFARAAIGTNNIDCCARLCHGPSVAGLQQTLGNGAMSNSIGEIENTDCILVFGYNAADSHPIVARRILKAKNKGAKLIVCDPRHIETARIADQWLPLKNGANMALVNAFIHVLIEEKLYDANYVRDHTRGFDELKAGVAAYRPEDVEPITGLSAKAVRQAMRTYAAAPAATLLWGMGVTQWGQAVDVVKGLSSLALLTGNLGRPNVGVGPVRGQNNVQGACDMGVLPNTFPGYEKVTDSEARARFAHAWGVAELPAHVGYSITDVPHKVAEGKLKAYYVFGEDPIQTEPDLAAMRAAFAALDLVVVQDIFMTKTAELADVVLPATSWGEHEGVYTSADRGFQHFNKAIEPKGDVKPDWEIISLISTAMGYPMAYQNTQQIWDEMRGLCPPFAGVTYEKLAGLGYVQWPCPTEDHPGTPYLYTDNQFATADGKGLLSCAPWQPPHEQTDSDYPLALCTVREVGHYSCRSMTGNCGTLKILADEPGYVQIHPEDASYLGVIDQALIWISSRRGKVIARASVTERANRGAVYMTYQWWIGACNELTVDHVDPVSKTPEFKHCAVKVEAISDQTAAEQYVEQQYSQLKKRLSDAAVVP